MIVANVDSQIQTDAVLDYAVACVTAAIGSGGTTTAATAATSA